MSMLLRSFIVSVQVFIFAPAVIAQPWVPKILSADSSAYLPDYSYAGYYWGEKSLPQLAPTIDVTQFGAVANDNKDDTAALKAAFNQANDTSGTVVVHFPKGRFILSDIIYITRGDIVVQGEGSGTAGTTIFVPRPLREMNYPFLFSLRKLYYIAFNKWSRGKLYSLFSWAGGVFWTKQSQSFRQQALSITVLGGQRGAHEISVDDTQALQVGDVIEIQWYNHEGKNGSLIKHIFGDYNLPVGERLYEYWYKPLVTQPVTVVSVESGKISIKEPLLLDVRPQWFPALVKINYLNHIGIEHLRIEFPATHYAGHHLEDGYNAFYLTDVQHSWMRDITIHNSDAAVLTDNCKNVTLDGITVTGREGHYSVHTGSCYGLLTKNFHFQSPAIHNPSFNTRSRLSVFSGGTIQYAKLDQHNGLNQQNLFDNISIDVGENIFEHGGAHYWQPTAGRFNTFWNLRINKTEAYGFLGNCKNAPEARLVGIVGENTDVTFTYSPQAYIEGTNKKDIAVPSLYQYQLQRRLLQQTPE